MARHQQTDVCAFEILWQIDGKPNFPQTAEVIWDLLVSNDKSSCHRCPDTGKWEIVAHRCLTTSNDLLTTSINLFSETLWKYPTVYNPRGNASHLFHVTLTLSCCDITSSTHSQGQTLADRSVCFESLWQSNGEPNYPHTAGVIWDLPVSNGKSFCDRCAHTGEKEIVSHRCLWTSQVSPNEFLSNLDQFPGQRLADTCTLKFYDKPMGNLTFLILQMNFETFWCRMADILL